MKRKRCIQRCVTTQLISKSICNFHLLSVRPRSTFCLSPLLRSLLPHSVTPPRHDDPACSGYTTEKTQPTLATAVCFFPPR